MLGEAAGRRGLGILSRPRYRVASRNSHESGRRERSVNSGAAHQRLIGTASSVEALAEENVRPRSGSMACASAGALQAMRDRRGRLVTAGETTEIDEYVDPAEIAGVEVYSRGMLAPPQFVPPGDRTAASCAIVVFWTKHG